MTLTVEITSFSGFATSPTVAVPQPQHAEPQGEPQRPTLRVVK